MKENRPQKIPLSFGQYLRRLRIRREMTALEVAEQMGFKTANSVIHWERERRRPTAEQVEKLAKIYRVPKHELKARMMDKLLKDIEKQFAHIEA